jgi:hypothetical protein
VSLVLQGAMADVDAEYQTMDTTTNTAGAKKFFRPKPLPRRR